MQPMNRQEKPRYWLLGGLITLMTLLVVTSLRGRKGQQSLPLTQESVPPSAPKRAILKGTARRNIILVACALLFIAAIGLFSTQFFPGVQARTTGSASKSVPRVTSQRIFEHGIIYPRWQADAYSTSDKTWQTSAKTMKEQTSAAWIEMPVMFSQADTNSTEIEPSANSTPTLKAFIEGVRSAHALGYRVFFVPLMQVRIPGGWSGSVQPPSNIQQSWFDHYWSALQPYAQAAADNGVEQMAIATELQWLQQNAPSPLWEQLIDRAHSTFKGILTYDMNWSSLDTALPTWLQSPNLSLVGVSSYIPLLDKPGHLTPSAISTLWKQQIKSKLDGLSSKVGKRVLISEIGYRNSSDTLYHTWEATTSAAKDPQEQAAACDATLSNTWNDPQIAGTFFWGWDGVDRFALKGQPAVQVLNKWYSLPQAA